MLTGEIRNQVDQLWSSFWAGGIANPIDVITQITYLLFLRRLDELQSRAEAKSRQLKQPLERQIFPAGVDRLGTPFAHLRWTYLKNQHPAEQFELVRDHAFPFLLSLGAEGSSYGVHMRDAVFIIGTPNLLSKAIQLIDAIRMDDRDTKGDVYEYMLSKIASAGQNGQFRTPRHIIQLMVAMTVPTPRDTICDPASGTCGFLVAAGEYVREHNPDLFFDPALTSHFNHELFHGFDSDGTMLRIGSMNLLLHGVENPNIQRRDSLSEDNLGEAGRYSLVLANPPFAGSLDYETTAKDLQQIVKTKKTELLFLALFLRILQVGGRAAVIVPDGVLFGSSNPHKSLRRMLVEEHLLEAVVSLPSGAFKPYAGVSTAILFFTKTGVGGTEDVWFYDVQADGFSLDDKRTPLLPEDKLGVSPRTPLDDPLLSSPSEAEGSARLRVGAGALDLLSSRSEAEGSAVAFGSADHARNNLPDVLARWQARTTTERDRPRTAQSFLVPRAEIAENNYDLSLNRYKQVVHEEVTHISPKQILAELNALELEIQEGLRELEEMLG